MDYKELYGVWQRNFVRECRKKKMDLLDLANQAGLSKTNICCYTTGSKKPSPRQITKLCNKWNIPVEKVFRIPKSKSQLKPINTNS